MRNLTTGRQIAKSSGQRSKGRIAYWMKQGKTRLPFQIGLYLAIFISFPSFLYTRYLDFQIASLQPKAEAPSVEVERISEFDELVYLISREHGLDWRLISSIIFAESSFRPNVKSHAGAMGLMQVMPVVAREQSIDDIWNPESNVLAGVRHLQKKLKIIKGATDEDTLKLSLAAYNAGLGHLRDAQRLAIQRKKNPRKWENVREALLLLEKPEFYQSARYGYVRGSEPVAYVQKVLEVYEEYQRKFPNRPVFATDTSDVKPSFPGA